MKHLFQKVLSMILALTMVFGLLPPVQAEDSGLRWKESDVTVRPDRSHRVVQKNDGGAEHSPDDLVRVSIVLTEKPTLRSGISTAAIAANAQAQAYNKRLKERQHRVAEAISARVLGGKSLDVVWNLTLVSNVISAYVPYGKIKAIEAIPGVDHVSIEQRYHPLCEEKGSVQPNMFSASGMTGADRLWSSGLTGAGMRIAIVDTGTDLDHQSFSPSGFLYALEQNAALRGMDTDAYLAGLDLMDQSDIAAVLTNLNAYERGGFRAEDMYFNPKVPFGFNYIDYDLIIDHDSDYQGSHGSHVAGIAAANRYLPGVDGFIDAMQNVYMAGVAPDAQILTMKVFGRTADIYDSDYMAAVEDAIWLGADAVNLSLGSSDPGTAASDVFTDFLSYLETTPTVVVISAGNSGFWAQATTFGYPYSDNVNFDMVGSPGSYTNAFTVGSVENDGVLGNFFTVADHPFYYDEQIYTNVPMSSFDLSPDGSGTAYEYVDINALGAEGDFDGIPVAGKIVLCSRGELNFAVKANNAVSRGAIAVVIYNNEPGLFGMDLTGYEYTAPCVAISLEDGDLIRSVSDLHFTDAGNAYYTGTMLVHGTMKPGSVSKQYYTVSDFSSWGVPGDLSLKPEIIAPGGNIYSINGMDPSGTGYEWMSGTSMAAPQITGMAALLQENLQQTGLAERYGLTGRALVQSLLMSTAQPIYQEESGNYYSLLAQGAGLARVDLAAAADSFLMVSGTPDGKVKAELGDDPDRSGAYSFTFTVHNISDRALSYDLSADVFTQDVFEYQPGSGIYLMDTWTRPLAADVRFTSGGNVITGAEGFECDLNGDGATDSSDADHLLSHLLTGVELYGDGDLDGDGVLTSFDAHLLLKRMGESGSVLTVPAGASADVTVTMVLTEQAKAELDENYPSGTYLEAFVYAAERGGVTHSIPVLGFYGSWSESPMFEEGTLPELLSGGAERPSYLQDWHNNYTNYLCVDYGDGTEYYFGGNPLDLTARYDPARDSFNNEKGHVLSSVGYTLIRNAQDLRLEIRNAHTGEIYHRALMGGESAAYYNVNAGMWDQVIAERWLDLTLAGIPEGTAVEICLTAAPEYYRIDDSEGSYSMDWSALSDSCSLCFPLVIDNTDPQILDIALDPEDSDLLRITAQDNRYVAAVAIADPNGSILAYQTVDQLQPGTQEVCRLDLTGVYGSRFLVMVYDYAENEAVFEVELDRAAPSTYFTIFDGGANRYSGLDFAGNLIPIAGAANGTVVAATFVDGYVFQVTEDSMLWVAPASDLFRFESLGLLDANGDWDITNFLDLAYDRTTSTLYGLFYSSLNGQQTPYLCSIDIHTGAMNVLGSLDVDVNNLAIDDAGNFYSSGYGTADLYTYGPDAAQGGPVTYVGSMGYYSTEAYNPLAWDHNAGVLYRAYPSTLLKIDPHTAYTEVVTYYSASAYGFYIAYEPDSDPFLPTEQISSITIIGGTAVLTGFTTQLSAVICPWYAVNDAVMWSSSDPSVATVDENGCVSGIAPGSAVITATAAADPSVSASCTVTVQTAQIDLNGIVWDEYGDVWWSQIRLDGHPEYIPLKKDEQYLPLTSAMVSNGAIYAATFDLGTMTSDLYAVDPDTFETTWIGQSFDCFVDIANAPGLGLGVGVSGGGLYLFDLTSGETVYSHYQFYNDLVGITYYGTERYTDYGFDANVDYFLILDNMGTVYLIGFLEQDGQWYYLDGVPGGIAGTIGDPVDTSYFQGFYYDGNCAYWTRYDSQADRVELILWDCDHSGNAYSLGHFPGGVWPVCGLYTSEDTGEAWPYVPMSCEKTERMPCSAEPVIQPPISAGGLMNAPVSHTEQEDTQQLSVYSQTGGVSGIVSIAYDSAVLEVLEVAGTTQAFAWTVEQGMVRIAFASENELAANTLLAELRLNSLPGEDHPVTVTQTQSGADVVHYSHTALVHGHVFVADTTLPTCTEPGVTAEVCSCGIRKGEQILPATGHRWDEGTVIKAPTELETGILEYTCTACGETRQEQIPVLDHVHAYVTVVTDPTCTADGYTTYTCSCGDSYVSDQVEATGHQFADGICSACGAQDPDYTEPMVNPFTDVTAQDYYYEPVMWAVRNGITSGLSATTFGPGNPCTRAQVVTFLWRAFGQPTPRSQENPFADVPANAYYYDAVLWAVEQGITAGTSATTFSPDNPCTRDQVVTFLWRAMGKPEPAQDDNPFADVPENAYYYVPVLWAVEQKITSGTSATTFAPSGPCTRGQVVTFLFRTMK